MKKIIILLILFTLVLSGCSKGSLQADNNQTQEANLELENKIKGLEEEVRNLQAKLEEKKIEIEELQNTIEELESQKSNNEDQEIEQNSTANKIRDRVEYHGVEFVVEDMTFQKSISFIKNDGTNSKVTANGQYLIVEIKANSKSKISSALANFTFSLYDANDNSYSPNYIKGDIIELVDNSIVIEDKENLILTINPKESATGTAIFDVSDKEAEYTLKINYADSMTSEYDNEGIEILLSY